MSEADRAAAPHPRGCTSSHQRGLRCGAGLVRKSVSRVAIGLYLPGRDVSDPMGQGDGVFNDCAVLIEAGAALHIGRSRP